MKCYGNDLLKMDLYLNTANEEKETDTQRFKTYTPEKGKTN